MISSLQRFGLQNTVLSAVSVNIDGMNYAADMVVSVGSCGVLPEFRQIKQCRHWYHGIMSIFVLMN